MLWNMLDIAFMKIKVCVSSMQSECQASSQPADSARHKSMVTVAKLYYLGFKLLTHSSYFPDLALRCSFYCSQTSKEWFQKRNCCVFFVTFRLTTS